MSGSVTGAVAELNNTSWVILGLLRLTGEKTGYELKALVDSSTQFFWPASYGRIYPELHRLAADGYVASRDEPRGGRPRKLYALTDTGAEALDEWLTRPGEPLFEIRDEAILRLFLGEATSPADRVATVRAMQAREQALVDRLRELEPFVRDTYGDDFPLMTLELGIAFHEWYLEACQRLEGRLEGRPPERPDPSPTPG